MKKRKKVNFFTLLWGLFFLTSLSITEAKECNGKEIIGSKVSISFPDMSLYDITAKVDTGAYSSALHCNYIDIDHRKKSVRFSPLNSKRIYQYPLIKMKNVKSSQGNKQHRAFIKLRVLINDQEYDTIFSLTTRHEMRSAVLLGRKTLVDRFIVDVSLYK